MPTENVSIPTPAPGTGQILADLFVAFFVGVKDKIKALVQRKREQDRDAVKAIVDEAMVADKNVTWTDKAPEPSVIVNMSAPALAPPVPAPPVIVPGPVPVPAPAVVVASPAPPVVVPSSFSASALALAVVEPGPVIMPPALPAPGPDPTPPGMAPTPAVPVLVLPPTPPMIVAPPPVGA